MIHMPAVIPAVMELLDPVPAIMDLEQEAVVLAPLTDTTPISMNCPMVDPAAAIMAPILAPAD